MSEGTSSSSSGGIGFVGLLTILFIAFKLLGVITWSWWWVLAPALISSMITVLVILLIVAIAMMAGCGPKCVKQHDEVKIRAAYTVPAHYEDHGYYMTMGSGKHSNSVWIPNNLLIPEHLVPAESYTVTVCDQYESK